jgi:hypothetical protein
MPTWDMIQNMRRNAANRKAAAKDKSFQLRNRGEHNRKKSNAKDAGSALIVDDPHDPNKLPPDPEKVKEWYTRNFPNVVSLRAEAKSIANAHKLVGEIYTIGNTIADALHFHQLDDALRESLSKNLIAVARQLAPRKRKAKK